MQDEWDWLGSKGWLARYLENEINRRQEYEGREKSRVEEKPPQGWRDQIYIGKEEYDWAEIGPLPRGGK
eukprot:scaffold102157_cov108-Cyclotella_meneghiniana.AAC.1